MLGNLRGSQDPAYGTSTGLLDAPVPVVTTTGTAMGELDAEAVVRSWAAVALFFQAETAASPNITVND